MGRDFPFDIVQIAQLLHLKTRAIDYRSTTFDACCPFCGDTHYKLNAVIASGKWRCNRCGMGGGMLELYARVALGCASYSKEDGKRAYAEILENLHLGKASVKRQAVTQIEQEEMPIAPDAVLHRVYSALLHNHAFALSDEHKRALMERGLDEKSILLRRYRTMPPIRKSVMETKAGQYVIAHAQDWKQSKSLSKMSHTELTAGLLVAEVLQKQGLKLEGVPGFFQLGDRWCFRMTAQSIMIPVRNADNLITGFQMRMDCGSVKYITLSTARFPNGSKGIARVHYTENVFCENNSTQGKAVFLTEGPLKADAIAAMGQYPTIAIMGINQTKALGEAFALLKKRGITTVYDVLDMDRFTNINVCEGARRICELAQTCGMQYTTFIWDREGAQLKLEEYSALLEQHNLPLPETSNTFKRLEEMAITLAYHKIEYNSSWCAEQKGLDDHLRSQMKCNKKSF